MILGLDFYGTIQCWPNELEVLAKTVITGGGKLYIITACYPEHKQKTEDMINASGIPYTAIEFIFYRDELEVPAKKLAACRKLGVQLYIDDLPFIVNHLSDNGLLCLKIKGKSKSRIL